MSDEPGGRTDPAQEHRGRGAYAAGTQQLVEQDPAHVCAPMRRRRTLHWAPVLAAGAALTVIGLVALTAVQRAVPAPAAAPTTPVAPSAQVSSGLPGTTAPVSRNTSRTRAGLGPDRATADELVEFRRSLSADPATRFRQVRALGEADAAASYLSTGPDIAKALAVTEGAVIGTVVGVDLPGSELLLRIQVDESTSAAAPAGKEIDVSTAAGFEVDQEGELIVLKPTGWTLARFPPGQKVVVLFRKVVGGTAQPTSIGWLLVARPDGSLGAGLNWPETRAAQKFTAAELIELVEREHR